MSYFRTRSVGYTRDLGRGREGSENEDSEPVCAGTCARAYE